MTTALDVATLGYTIPESVLCDLAVRFILNIPEEEKSELVRVCFQIELAHWFFVDNFCQPGSELDHLAHIPFNIFALQLFDITPYLRSHRDKVDKVCSEFRAYKNKVPVYGGILLSPDLSEVLLVQGFRCQWGFPKGKINKEEDEVLCAVREVLEETGYDIKDLINPEHYIESSQNDRLSRLYVVAGVNRDFPFRPQTAFEIKEISWFGIDELPENKKDITATPRDGYTTSNFYTVFTYVRRLKRWITDKLDGTNQLQNFKVANDPQARTTTGDFRNFPEHPFFPITPSSFSMTSPMTQYLETMTPAPFKPKTVKRRLDFNEIGTDSFWQEQKQEQGDILKEDKSTRTPLSLAMLFGQSKFFQDFSSHEPIEGEENQSFSPEPFDFFNGPGSSAWTDFKLDLTTILAPFHHHD